MPISTREPRSDTTATIDITMETIKSESNTMDNNDELQVFKVLEGCMKNSDYGNFCLFVPDSVAGCLLEALNEASNPQYDWSICDDEITNVENIPTVLGHPIRSINGEDIPMNKSESELLDWLIHGESFFSHQYVILEFSTSNGKWDGDQIPFEIRKKTHRQFHRACTTIADKSYGNGDTVFCELIDRGRFLRDFGDNRNPIIVDDKILKNFAEGAFLDGAELAEWIHSNLGEVYWYNCNDEKD